MEPIISPWVFYLIGITNHLITLGELGLLCSSIFACFILFMAVPGTPRWESPVIIKLSIMLGVFLIIFSGMIIFIPTPETIYKMIAASFVTPNNVDLAVDGAVKAKDALVNDALSIITAIANAAGK